MKFKIATTQNFRASVIARWIYQRESPYDIRPINSEVFRLVLKAEMGITPQFFVDFSKYLITAEGGAVSSSSLEEFECTLDFREHQQVFAELRLLILQQDSIKVVSYGLVGNRFEVAYFKNPFISTRPGGSDTEECARAVFSIE